MVFALNKKEPDDDLVSSEAQAKELMKKHGFHLNKKLLFGPRGPAMALSEMNWDEVRAYMAGYDLGQHVGNGKDNV